MPSIEFKKQSTFVGSRTMSSGAPILSAPFLPAGPSSEIVVRASISKNGQSPVGLICTFIWVQDGTAKVASAKIGSLMPGELETFRLPSRLDIRYQFSLHNDATLESFFVDENY